MALLGLARRVVPESLQTPIGRILSPLIPVRWRMGREYWRLREFLREAQWWDREAIEAWQLKRLQKIVNHAYENVPGYRSLYRDAGVRPEDMTCLDDIRKLPFTTKELLRDNLEDFTAGNIPSWKRRYVTTGGSTGIPFGFYHTPSNRWMENAFMHSGWERAGWRLGDASAVLRGAFVGSEERFWEYDSASRRLRLSSYYLTDRTYPEYVRKIEEFNPRHLEAYPSALTILADLLLEHSDVGRVGFDTILLGSEKIYDWQKEILRKAFPGARLFGWYGHTEQAVLGHWCEEVQKCHVWPFYGLTEILDSKNGRTEPGSIGEIVGTSFWSYATPFIRYRTMDEAQRGICYCGACGREFLVLENIEGRVQDTLVSCTGRHMPVPSTSIHTDAFDNVRKFQFYQDTPGEVTLRVVRKPPYADEDTKRIRKELEEKLGKDMELELVFVDEVPRTRRGKHRFLIQELDVGVGSSGS